MKDVLARPPMARTYVAVVRSTTSGSVVYKGLRQLHQQLKMHDGIVVLLLALHLLERAGMIEYVEDARGIARLVALDTPERAVVQKLVESSQGVFYQSPFEDELFGVPGCRTIINRLTKSGVTHVHAHADGSKGEQFFTVALV